MQLLSLQTHLSTAPEAVDFRRGCEMVGISVRKAERMLADPKSDFVRPFYIGRKRYFRPGDLALWVKNKAAAAVRAA